jgi:hypothetical protein
MLLNSFSTKSFSQHQLAKSHRRCSLLEVTTAIFILRSDPMPKWLLKANADILSPFLCRLFWKLLESGDVPSALKSAYIMPILKKANLDPADPQSYQLISNLSVVSKMLKRTDSKQLVGYPKDHDLQSANTVHLSTETAVLEVL